ncbi:MAG: chitobiase/beta-hexosaminidase C-terminal domain-containing protein, partial [Bacteroidales bacterium]
MTGYYESDGVLYPPESELFKQGLTLSTYKQSLKATAPKNRNSSVGNIWGTSPLTGTVRIPVLLVQFSDKSPTYTQSQINNYFNSPTITTDSISVSKYYNKQSYGQLNIIFDVYNWTTMPQTFAYYSSTINNEFQLVVDAYNTFNSSVNFAQYDNDNDGRIDGMVLIYPDIGRTGATGIWPHTRILRNYTNYSVDGKYFGNAALVPEKINNSFQKINTITHEFGHVLGLPDLYSLSPTGQSSGPIWALSMMTSDCLNKPMNLDVWSRYFLGWIEPDTLTTESDKIINLRSINDYPDAVILRNSNMGPREFFIIENRHKNLSDIENLDNCVFFGETHSGLLIYHVDENKIEAHYPNNWVNWDPDGNYFDDSSWPGITNEINYLPGGTYSTNGSLITYSNFTYNGCNFAYFDENNHICQWRPFSMTTRSYSGNLNPLIRFQALTGPNQQTMTAKMLVWEETTTPSSTPTPGNYSQTTQVTLSTTTPQATIYYTTDGTDPTTSSQVYSTPITIPENTTLTIKAIAKRNGYYVSDVMTSTYTITGTVATPTASQPSGVIDYLSQVTFTTTTTGATIRYTLNGSEPTESSLLYSSPITITGNTTLKARAFKTGYSPSQTVTYNYQVLSVEPVVSTLDSGYYFYGTPLELYTPTAGAEIRYTTNGTEPTQSSTLYTGQISITTDFTLKAKAYKQGFAPSQVSTYVYDTGAAPENLIIDFELQGIESDTQINNDQNLVIVRIPFGINRNSLIPIIQVEEGCSVYPESGISQNFNNSVNYTVSSVTGQRTYTVTVINNPRVFAPVASVSGGNFSEPITVELSTQTPGAVIKYTTNGSFPMLSSNTYDGPITISSTTTLKAKAYLYTGPGFISNNSSKQNTGRNIPNLIPTAVIWHGSSILTEEY